MSSDEQNTAILRYLKQIRQFFQRAEHQERDDLVGEAVLRLLVAERHGLQLRPELVRVVCERVWVDHLRRHKRRCENEVQMGEGEDASVQWEADAVLRVDISSALQRLTREEQQILEWRYVHGMSHAQIAQNLGVDEPCARQRCHRALLKLRDVLGEYER
ncbi:MAG: sigma-70 family RNA polymerase sigma factor [Chthonomonadetes bacterium]|nr:sigma-70 family RNA polymerase sigma factor [Chthonomonadetes bacterium]